MSGKPLSEKKLKRMLRKQEEKGTLPKPPKNLKGKEIGLWYRDQRRKLKQTKEKEIVAPEEKKITKKEKKALKKKEMKKLKEQQVQGQCFRIKFDPVKQQMIQNFLNSVAGEPPSFLLPVNEYHNKIKKRFYDTQRNTPLTARTEIENDTAEMEKMNVDNPIVKSKELYENFPINFSREISITSIQSFLTHKEADSSGSIEYHSDGCKDNEISRNSISEYTAQFNDTNQDILDSLDKYKHLEETAFKQNFIEILSQNIQSKLDKAVRFNEALQRNRSVDKELYNSFINKQNNYRYRHMKNARMSLPAFKMQREILNLINNNQVVLISGETGCGKTTQVAQFILDDAIVNHNGSLCNIICTQPRRISAISVAQRVSDERVESLGRESIGYQIRLEKKIGRNKGAILYCTTGILLQYMQSDPALRRYSHVILDEIHERDILCDFVLTLLRDVVAKRTNLKLILMSATLNAEQFSAYFYDCPSINIPGYTFPVKECYLEDVLQLTKFSFKGTKKRSRDQEDDKSFTTHVLPYVEKLKQSRAYSDFVLEELKNPESEKINPDLIVQLVKHISCDAPGAILIFVPGWEDINSVTRKFNESDFFSASKFLIIPLHSMLPTGNQQTVFDRPPTGKRKIVIATNIAETSITIDDVVYVIDCGKIKIKNYDVVNNISTLKPEFVSLANARQRRGRAGRVQSGICYHLFSRGRESALVDYPLPEMLRTRLEEVILNIKLLQLGKASPFLEKVMDPPNLKTVSLALELLRQLNALDENENLTPLGFHLAKLPLDPQIGKMLLMGVTMSCLNPILSIAAALSHKDPFYLPLGEEKMLKERKLLLDKGHKSDHLIMAEVMDRWEIEEKRGRANGARFCSENFLTRGTMFMLRDLKNQFAHYLSEMGFLNNTDYKHANLNMNSKNIAIIKAVICSGLYPNVAIIKRKINTKTRGMVFLRTSEDGNVTLHPKSVNTVQQKEFESCFLVYHEKLRSSCIFIYDTTMVPTLPLLFFCYDFFLTGTGNDVIIQLNKDLKFSCDKTTANLIVELKLRLNWLLEYKLSHPGQISWKDSSSDIELLKILTDLFTAENDVIMAGKNDCTSE